MAHYDDISAGAISVTGFVSIIITFVIIVAAQVLFYQSQEFEKNRKLAAFPINEGEAELITQQEALESYAWIDRDKGVVSQPISISMKNVLATIKSSESPKKASSVESEIKKPEIKKPAENK